MAREREREEGHWQCLICLFETGGRSLQVGCQAPAPGKGLLGDCRDKKRCRTLGTTSPLPTELPQNWDSVLRASMSLLLLAPGQKKKKKKKLPLFVETCPKESPAASVE
jgi:hypothetical protein